jgi:hypothetical protein
MLLTKNIKINLEKELKIIRDVYEFLLEKIKFHFRKK